jgi:hypothetical protein
MFVPYDNLTEMLAGAEKGDPVAVSNLLAYWWIMEYPEIKTKTVDGGQMNSELYAQDRDKEYDSDVKTLGGGPSFNKFEPYYNSAALSDAEKSSFENEIIRRVLSIQALWKVGDDQTFLTGTAGEYQLVRRKADDKLYAMPVVRRLAAKIVGGWLMKLEPDTTVRRPPAAVAAEATAATAGTSWLAALGAGPINARMTK